MPPTVSGHHFDAEMGAWIPNSHSQKSPCYSCQVCEVYGAVLDGKLKCWLCGGPAQRDWEANWPHNKGAGMHHWYPDPDDVDVLLEYV